MSPLPGLITPTPRLVSHGWRHGPQDIARYADFRAPHAMGLRLSDEWAARWSRNQTRLVGAGLALPLGTYQWRKMFAKETRN